MTEERFTQLGRKVAIPASPNDAVIETIKNRNEERHYCVRFTSPEFTSLCRVTGQPDFATIVIDYVPKKLLVESKSIKLFLSSFRNYQAFHEECINTIARRLSASADPHWLRVAGFFYPRGGIPIDVLIEMGDRGDVAVFDLDVKEYHGR